MTFPVSRDFDDVKKWLTFPSEEGYDVLNEWNYTKKVIMCNYFGREGKATGWILIGAVVILNSYLINLLLPSTYFSLYSSGKQCFSSCGLEDHWLFEMQMRRLRKFDFFVELLLNLFVASLKLKRAITCVYWCQIFLVKFVKFFSLYHRVPLQQNS